MANNLINGPAQEETPAQVQPPADLVPPWGYSKSGEAKLFDLKPGEKLPKGWLDTPQEKPESEPDAGS